MRFIVRANRDVFVAAQLKTGFTLRQLAAAMGVSHAAVSLWRSGKNGPTMENAREVALVLGVPVEELWETRIVGGPEASAPVYPLPPPTPPLAPVTFPGWEP